MASPTPSRSVSSTSTALDASTPDTIDPATAEKTAQIIVACDDRCFSELLALASSEHGLVNDRLRRKAWPILLGCNDEDPQAQPNWNALPPHREEEQVAKDVNRAFVHYPKESDRQLAERKEGLQDLIIEVLRRHPSLCYFQGFHDIAQVLYLVLGAQSAPAAVTRLSLLRIRDYMLPSLDPAIRHLELLPEIIKAEDPELYNHLPKIPPNYALGATLTLFSHVIEAYGDITRLFDYFLASDTAVPVYFFATLILSRREELLEIEKDEDEAIFFVMLGRLPQPFDLELRIAETTTLYDRRPPQSLRWAWWKVSPSSVLKATKTPHAVATVSLDEAQQLLSRQEKEVRLLQVYQRATMAARRLKRQAWRYRRPAAYGLSIAVGLYALWLGRQYGRPFGNSLSRIMGMFV